MGVIVLIVDDDESVRVFHQIIVSQSQLSTDPICFKDASEAFDYLNQNANGTDNYLIILDINMPGMTGWEFLDAISNKNYHKQLNIVMVSSAANEADHKRAKSYSTVIDFVEKPISVAECKKIKTAPSIAQYF